MTPPTGPTRISTPKGEVTCQWLPGRGGDRALVFLHEGLGSIAQWKDLPARMANATGLPALVYDRLGHGASDPWPERPTLARFDWEVQEALPRLLRAHGILRPILLGHSDGGTLALQFAATFPEMPLGVLSLAAHVLSEEPCLEGIRRALQTFPREGVLPRLGRYHADPQAVVDLWSKSWLDPEARDWDMRPQLPRIQAPTLVIQGAEDPYGTVTQVESLQRGLGGPRASLWIGGCGHVPQVQAASLVVPAMVQFIRSL